MDSRLLDILVCPTSHVPLRKLSNTARLLINQACAGGDVVNGDGQPISGLSAGLITTDGARVYPIVDDIPVLLPEAAIATAQILGFSAN